MTKQEMKAEIKRLRALVREAVDDLEGWGAYADDYFKKKWDLKGNVADLRRRAGPVVDDNGPAVSR